MEAKQIKKRLPGFWAIQEDSTSRNKQEMISYPQKKAQKEMFSFQDLAMWMKYKKEKEKARQRASEPVQILGFKLFLFI